MNNSYSLNFVIPQGPTGPTGPASTSSINAYGGKYNNTSSSITLSINTPTQIPLTNTMPSNNVNYSTANSIVLNQGGIYEINYYANISLTIGATLTLAVRNNGTSIPGTIITKTISAGSNSIYNGNILINLSAGSVLDMTFSSLVALGITLANGVNASLTVKKIS